MKTGNLGTRLVHIGKQCVASLKWVAAPEVLAPLTPDEQSDPNGEGRPLWRFVASRDELSSDAEPGAGAPGLFRFILDRESLGLELKPSPPPRLQLGWLVEKERLPEADEPEHAGPGRPGLFQYIFASDVLHTEAEASREGLAGCTDSEPLPEEEPEHPDLGPPGLFRHIFSRDTLSWELRPESSEPSRLQWLFRQEPFDTIEPSDSTEHRKPSVLKWILSREPFDAEVGEEPQEAQSLMRWVFSREPLNYETDGSKDGETPRPEA